MGVTGHKLELIEAHGAGNQIFGAAKRPANGNDPVGARHWSAMARHSNGKINQSILERTSSQQTARSGLSVTNWGEKMGA
jgi:hypothetical protein